MDNAKQNSSNKTPLTDSPWFWACLFASVGLGALAAIGQRYDVRQTQVERKAQGRLRAAEQATAGEASTPVSDRGNLQVSILPLYAVLGVVLVFAWGALWWTHMRPHSEKEATTSTGAHTT